MFIPFYIHIWKIENEYTVDIKSKLLVMRCSKINCNKVRYIKVQADISITEYNA